VNFSKGSYVAILFQMLSFCDASQYGLPIYLNNYTDSIKDVQDLANEFNNKAIRVSSGNGELRKCPFMLAEQRENLRKDHPEVRDNDVVLTEKNELSWCGQPLSKVPMEDQNKIKLLIKKHYSVKIIFQEAVRISNGYASNGYYLKWQILKDNVSVN
jgi:hypothetical protein